MKKFPIVITALLAMFLLLPAASDAQVMVRTKQVAPGVTVVKTKPVKPGRNFVWVEGYWAINQATGRQVYVPGYWAKRRNVQKVKRVRHQHRRCHK